MRSKFLVFWMLAALGMTVTAIAQDDDGWKDAVKLCGEEPDDPNDSIAACTDAIDSGRMEGASLANMYYNRARVLMGEKRYDEAIADFDSAILNNDLDSAFYHDKGTAYRRKGDYSGAIESYTKAIDMGFQPAFGVYFNRGVAYHYNEDKDNALQDFLRANMLEPENAQVRKVLKDMYDVDPDNPDN